MSHSVMQVGLEVLLQAQVVVDLSLPDEADRDALLSIVGKDTGTKDIVRLVAVADGDTVGVAVGNKQGEHAYLDLIAVSAGYQRRGIGRSLLGAFEQWATSKEVRTLHVGGSTRRYAWPGIDTSYTGALSMLFRHGYQRSDVAFHMGVELDSPMNPTERALATLSSMGITVRPARESDLGVLEPYIAATFTTTWADEISAATRQPNSGAFVALQGERPIGFSGYSVFRASLFGPLATDPTLRGGGLGEILLRLSLERMRQAGVTTARICWIAENALPFYARSVGADLSNTFWIMSKSVGESHEQ